LTAVANLLTLKIKVNYIRTQAGLIRLNLKIQQGVDYVFRGL
jgi:hypothetical protein